MRSRVRKCVLRQQEMPCGTPRTPRAGKTGAVHAIWVVRYRERPLGRRDCNRRCGQRRAGGFAAVAAPWSRSNCHNPFLLSSWSGCGAPREGIFVFGFHENSLRFRICHSIANPVVTSGKVRVHFAAHERIDDQLLRGATRNPDSFTGSENSARGTAWVLRAPLGFIHYNHHERICCRCGKSTFSIHAVIVLCLDAPGPSSAPHAPRLMLSPQ
jgi:hypothetical protein